MCLPQSSNTTSATGTSSLETETEKLIAAEIIPKDELSQGAYVYAAQHLHRAVLNHSLRVYIYANQLATNESSEYSKADTRPLLFAACIFHDVGTVDAHDGPQRFEVEGADAASTFLKSHGISEKEAHEVWVAIALHTSPGIAERITELARLVRIGVLADFKNAAAVAHFSTADAAKAENILPRINIEKILGDAVVEQALRQRQKAVPASWAANLLRAKLENPDWTGVNKGF